MVKQTSKIKTMCTLCDRARYLPGFETVKCEVDDSCRVADALRSCSEFSQRSRSLARPKSSSNTFTSIFD